MGATKWVGVSSGVSSGKCWALGSSVVEKFLHWGCDTLMTHRR